MEDDHTEDLFAGVDALLAQLAQPLPPAHERAQLRSGAGLTREQVAAALRTSADLVEAWETGLVEPSGTQRAAYARLLQGLLAQRQALRQPAPNREAPTEQPTPARTPSPARQSFNIPAPRTTAAAHSIPASEDFPAGPLAVLSFDDDFTAHFADGTTRPCPAATIVDILHWALDAGLGQPPLAKKHGRAADPLIVLTPSANDYLGLPPQLEDRARLRLPEDHPWCAAITADGWKFTHSGFGPWARVYLPLLNGKRRSIQLAVTAWQALSTGGWNLPPGLPATQLAQWLGTYAQRVLTPRGSTAVCGQELMTSLRPPTKPIHDGSKWKSGDNPGALWRAIPPAPPEAHDAHPLARGRQPAETMDEEAWDWHRPLSTQEKAEPHVVGLDINLAFVSAAASLVVGLNAPPRHVSRPQFDPKIPGAWYCDLSHITQDPRLPSPFTPTGQPPAGPAWYTTHTLAYAAELKYEIAPIEAYLRDDAGRYLDHWHKHLRAAYLATMNDLGITPDMSQSDYLTAMSTLSQQDPQLLSLLAAIKATGKGGIGKLRAGPRDPHRAPFEAWPALKTPTWRPDIRAAVISRARVNLHRKMLKTHEHTGRYPLAVLSDCVLYPATRPTALATVPTGPDGMGIQGPFRLGVSPGMAKEEGVQTTTWYEHLQTEGFNPARYIKDAGPA
ncbi:helix-turn-helix domain-containing protein [Streptomyces sp. QL37]|uniref:telomere-associated protein Tap n=1 Tax=Streptomyces sp. QL37 TaxID=2093747 RepID=UPI000CF27A53|nr:helix-turn-helix domain-containing protein [Streptomyces sp. QL37]PPQ62049.1 transcriptional regulator [Streptomyces sp. QL37]